MCESKYRKYSIDAIAVELFKLFLFISLLVVMIYEYQSDNET